MKIASNSTSPLQTRPPVARQTLAVEESGLSLKDRVELRRAEGVPAKATFVQKAVAAAGIGATAAVGVGLAVNGAFSSIPSALGTVGAMAGAFLVADISTGLVHHFLDNVNPDKMPKVIGRIALDFQNHHHHQRDLVTREFADHTWDTQVVTTPVLAGLAVAAFTLPHFSALTAGAAVFTNCALLAQEFHKRAHMTARENGPIIEAAQKVGLMVPKALHGKHHNSGHKSHYALLNGATNKVLDDFKFRLTPNGPKTNILRKMEVAITKLQGCDVNAWDENPGLKAEALGLA